MAELIQKQDTLNDGREKLNAAITDAEVAKSTAGQAVSTSNQAKQIAQTAEDKADNVQSQFNQVVIEGDSSVEAAQARVPVEGEAYPTLKARLDAENAEVTSQLAQTQRETEILFKRTPEISITEFGAVADFDTSTLTGTDNSPAIQAAFDACPENGTILIPNGSFLTTKPLPVGKNVTYRGINSLNFNGSSTIVFVGCSGFVPINSYTKLRTVALYGLNKRNLIDLENEDYGTIGIDLQLSPTVNTGGFVSNDVRVEGFNVGMAQRASGGGAWAGAYRDSYTPILRKNDIGLVLWNGATHNKFYGGSISQNFKHGIYVVNKFSYSNIEFIGTTIEGNGSANVDSLDYGIYTKNSVKMNLIGCYLEHETVFADVDSSIYLSGTYVHPNVKLFGKDTGSINSDGSFALYKIPLKNGSGDDYLNMFTFSNLTPTSKGRAIAGVNVKSTSSKANIIMDNKGVFNMRTLKVNELEWVKFSAKVTVNGGINAPSFAVKPRLTINALGGSTDSMNRENTIPRKLYDGWVIGETRKIEFYYKPRITEGYLDANANLLDVRAGFLFYDNLTEVNYATDNLDVDIAEVMLEVYTKNQVSPLTVL